MNSPRTALLSPAVASVAAALLAGCPKEAEPECTELEQVFVYVDADGDGFGVDQPIGYTCTPGPNESTNKVDCDDERADVNPLAADVCDDVDNNCNGAIDEENAKLPYYLDADGDGYGSLDSAERVVACEPPPGYISVSGDCRDGNPDINPGVHETCNDGVDDDCDGAADDEDGSIELKSRTRYYTDADLDGYGDPDRFIDACIPPYGGILDGTDCDDEAPGVNPGQVEVCDGGQDNDCDGYADDDDDSIDPETQHAYYTDADGDTYGDPATEVLTCKVAPNGIIDGTDCDDTNALYHLQQDWLTDGDGDGWVGTVVVNSCTDPGGGLIPESAGPVDCDDASTSVYPFAPETCNDGIDQDCNTRDQCASCEQWITSDPALVDGVYEIEPPGLNPLQVWCDMTTDGGGWSVVASTLNTTLIDKATSTPYADLQTLSPINGHNSVWDGLRGLGSKFDMRFACKKDVLNVTMDVDLSIYDTAWYLDITASTQDFSTCFNESDGFGDDPTPPARRNNLTGDFLPLGDQWNAGYIEGEDSCAAADQFTVDFDDRGVAGDPMDGTDWGNDLGMEKCADGPGETWYILVREL